MKREKLSKRDWLKRCETVWKNGHARPDLLALMRSWLDAVMRYEHSLLSYGQTQGRDWLEFLKAEDERTSQGRYTLANDADGYALQQIAAILSHPCQKCAEDPQAWHTRPGFCNHHREIEQ